MKDVMVDIETMGTGSDAGIIAIGAIAFDDISTGDSFYKDIAPRSALDSGGTIDTDVIRWWLKQGAYAQLIWDSSNNHKRILLDFKVWLEDTIGSNVRVWGNGAAFDNVILSNAYKREGLAVPWNFWNDRCYRTVKNLHPDINQNRIGTIHNALDDATTQAAHLVRIVQAHGFKL